MEGPKKKPNLVKACTARFSFRESCDFLLDYNGFMLSDDDKSGEGKFIRISFNSRPGRKRKLGFKCRYKMMTNCDRSLN
ncbi:hypothetical protein ACW6NC_15270 [Salegentibacter sp. F14]